MKINNGIAVGKYIRLYRDNGDGPDNPARPMVSIGWSGSAMSTPITEDVLLALIEALQHPETWPLRYDFGERAR